MAGGSVSGGAVGGSVGIVSDGTVGAAVSGGKEGVVAVGEVSKETPGSCTVGGASSLHPPKTPVNTEKISSRHMNLKLRFFIASPKKLLLPDIINPLRENVNFL